MNSDTVQELLMRFYKQKDATAIQELAKIGEFENCLREFPGIKDPKEMIKYFFTKAKELSDKGDTATPALLLHYAVFQFQMAGVADDKNLFLTLAKGYRACSYCFACRKFHYKIEGNAASLDVAMVRCRKCGNITCSQCVKKGIFGIKCPFCGQKFPKFPK